MQTRDALAVWCTRVHSCRNNMCSMWLTMKIMVCISSLWKRKNPAGFC
jgi:hypothetical protein